MFDICYYLAQTGFRTVYAATFPLIIPQCLRKSNDALPCTDHFNLARN